MTFITLASVDAPRVILRAAGHEANRRLLAPGALFGRHEAAAGSFAPPATNVIPRNSSPNSELVRSAIGWH